MVLQSYGYPVREPGPHRFEIFDSCNRTVAKTSILLFTLSPAVAADCGFI